MDALAAGRLLWRETDTVTYLEPTALQGHPWLRGAFTTRHAGCSGQALNLGFNQGETHAVLAHRQGLLQALGLAHAPLYTVRQVHGNQVCVVDADSLRQGLDGIAADALVTALPNVALGVLVADCLPLILYSLTTPVVAVVHAGRMGTYHTIVLRTLDVLAQRFDVMSADVHALLGPAIGGCCYRLDLQAVQPFQARFPDWATCFVPCDAGHWTMSLTTANTLQLLSAGVLPAHIETVSPCTVCHQTHFYSHRAEGQRAGRSMALAALQFRQ